MSFYYEHIPICDKSCVLAHLFISGKNITNQINDFYFERFLVITLLCQTYPYVRVACIHVKYIYLCLDLLVLLGKAKYFTSLNLKSGYWQVPMEKQDKEKKMLSPVIEDCLNITLCLLAFLVWVWWDFCSEAELK